MKHITIRITTSEPYCEPKYATSGSAGADVVAFLESPVTIPPHQTEKIQCGFCLELPNGYEAQIRPRSGLAAKSGITVLNAPGTIDSDYRGEVCVLLHNTSQTPFTVEPKMRIAQLVIAPVVQAAFHHATPDELSETDRGKGGFGSSGVL